MPKPFALAKSIPAAFAGMADALAGVFLPAGCRLCEKVLISASRIPICANCLESFARIDGKMCARCGLPLDAFPAELKDEEREPDGELRCGPCRMGAYHFDRTRSVFRYEDGVVRAIVMLKFEEMEPLADWFAERMARRISGDAAYESLDAVVPVPLHKVRERERGFNQAELLSKRLAEALRLPHEGVLLVRKRPRPNKHLLTERERWAIVRGAFATRVGSRIDKKRVLLVDDVMTTGATLDACAKVLRDAGVAEVCGLTVARAVLRNPRRVNV